MRSFVRTVQPTKDRARKPRKMKPLDIKTRATSSKPANRRPSNPLASITPVPPHTSISAPLSTSFLPVLQSSQEDRPADAERVEGMPPLLTQNAHIPSTGDGAPVMDVSQAPCKTSQDLSPTTLPHLRHSPSPDAASGSSDTPLQLISPSRPAERRLSDERHAVMVTRFLKEKESLPIPAQTWSPAAAKMTVSSEGMRDAALVKVCCTSNVNVNIAVLLAAHNQPASVPDLDWTTISVKVVNVMQEHALLDEKLKHIFYDSELLIIIHHSKSQKTTLERKTVWRWAGRKSKHGEREESKAAELTKVYGTSAVSPFMQSATFVVREMPATYWFR